MKRTLRKDSAPFFQMILNERMNFFAKDRKLMMLPGLVLIFLLIILINDKLVERRERILKVIQKDTWDDV